MEKTPEEEWNRVKVLIFKGNPPPEIEKIINDGFKESENESEKWEKLAAFYNMIKKKFG